APTEPPSRRPRGRPKGSTGATYAAVLRLFDRGRPPMAIAAKVGVSFQRVYQILKAAGRQPAYRPVGPRPRPRSPERFAAAWNAARSLAHAAQALGLTPAQAVARAKDLRHRGVRLKRMPRRGDGGREAVRLYRCGWSVEDIVRRTGLTRPYVLGVVRRLDLRDET